MRFLDANQGFRSRITDIVYFDDLDSLTLAKIFCSFAEKKGVLIADDCAEMLADYFSEDRSLEGVNFGNGRTARNLFNCAFRNLASRVGYRLTDGQPVMTKHDIRKAIDESLAQARRIAGNHSTGESHIGFTE